MEVKGYYGIETHLPDVIKNSVIYNSCEFMLSKATGNLDSQNAILETSENTWVRFPVAILICIV